MKYLILIGNFLRLNAVCLSESIETHTSDAYRKYLLYCAPRIGRRLVRLERLLDYGNEYSLFVYKYLIFFEHVNLI